MAHTQQTCTAAGGSWNPILKKCKLPFKPTPRPEPVSISPEENFARLKAEEEAKGFKGAGGFASPTGVELTSKEAGQAAIREREKRINELKAQGRPPDVAERLARQEQSDTAEIERQQRLSVEERQKLQLTSSPERRQLDPALVPGEEFPVIGPLLIQIKKALGITKRRGILDIVKGRFGEETPFPELQPEELRTLALTEIERQEIERGLTSSEKFGSFIEALNVGELQKYIPGAAGAEKPSDNVQTVLKSLRLLKTTAIDVELKYKKNLLSKSAAEDRLTELENEIQVGESRMKLLIQESPELKFNSDGVNFIELKILETRQRTFDSRIALTFPQTVEPSDIDILLALKEDVAEESFDIPGFEK